MDLLANLSSFPPSHNRLERAKLGVLERAFDRSGFGYSVKLKGHTSCVNAISISRGQGRWLASGGDDLDVLLWDLHSDLSTPETGLPSAIFKGHRANIFTLSFSSDNTHLFSSGIDGLILQYDLTRFSTPFAEGGKRDVEPELPCRRVNVNTKAVRALACHPSRPDLLLSASEDKNVSLHDFRLSTTLVHSLGNRGSFSGVDWSPVVENSFAACDESGGLRLFDLRSSFSGGPSSSTVRPMGGRWSFGQRPRYNDRSNCVMEYVTTLTTARTKNMVKPDLSGVWFSPKGDILATNMNRHLPTLYSIGDEMPIATLSGKKQPDGKPVRFENGERSYLNRCTVKHGSFGYLGAGGDLIYSTGSDDFHGYGWKIPSVEELIERRERQTRPLIVDQGGRSSKKIGYTKDDTKSNVYFPVELDRPAFRVGGHASVTNSCILHPVNAQMVISAGVECSILIHSPFPLSSDQPPVKTPPSRVPFSPLFPSRPARPSPTSSTSDTSVPLVSTSALISTSSLTRSNPLVEANAQMFSQAEFRRMYPDWRTIEYFDETVREVGEEDVIEFDEFVNGIAAGLRENIPGGFRDEFGGESFEWNDDDDDDEEEGEELEGEEDELSSMDEIEAAEMGLPVEVEMSVDGDETETETESRDSVSDGGSVEGMRVEFVQSSPTPTGDEERGGVMNG
ncbi:WD40 repeat protein [Phaffia rhodozyma]|uniref:WD40 repeat protein n=1 Tax=Phaffia rhodozyma TaxID=264483 RepID=A0A0F7SNX0_PHARH|nr:WD40 repeat protein [Phaffia rhodozyma]